MIETFDSLFLENAPLMVRFLNRRFRDRQLAVAQTEEAFEVLLDRWDEREHHPNLAGWLWKTLESLPRDRATRQGDPEMERLADELRSMGERDFDLEEIARRLEDERYDAVRALGLLHRRRAALFETVEAPPPSPDASPDVQEKRGKHRFRRPAWLGRAVAAAVLLVVVGMLGLWLFRGLTATPWQTVDGLVVAPFERFDQMLEKNELTVPMAPTLETQVGGRFGTLVPEFTAARFDGYDLFTAHYRDENGKGYTVKITRPDYPQVEDPVGAALPEAKEYVCDSVAYYIIPGDGETYRVAWGRGGLSGAIEGDLDLNTAMTLVRSITRTPDGRDPGTPALSPVLVYDSLPQMLAEHRLSGALAPTWLPEDLKTVDRFATVAGDDVDVTMVHSEYRGTGERMLALQVEWWESPHHPNPPTIQWEGSTYRTETREDAEYTLLSDGYAQILSWRVGHLSAWLYGTLEEEELWKIAQSMSADGATRPENLPPVAVEEARWPTLVRAVEGLGLDPDLVPLQMPEGYRVHQVRSVRQEDKLKIDAGYTWEGRNLTLTLTCYGSAEAARRSDFGGDKLVPVEIYDYNGFAYHITGYGDYRVISWRSGMLEGKIGGPLTQDQVYELIRAIPAELPTA